MGDYAILDNEGIIYQDEECEIYKIWYSIEEDSTEYFPDGWEGDLKLIKIIAVTR